jgi:broad specificity phosphatase PhoE
VGERLRGEGLEVIVASRYRRAQETAAAISEVLGLPVETDDDLHEIRQSDAYYAAAPHYAGTGTISWMPAAERGFAQPGAESFDAILGRVLRVQARLAARSERILCVTHWGFLHFFLGTSVFGDAFAPEHMPALYRVSHANTGISIFERREGWDIDGVEFSGWALVTWNDQGHL